MYNDKLIKQFEKEMSIEGDSFYAVKQQYIKWLENKVNSAMCEANSNAVLAEVRAEEITKIIHILKYAKRHDITLQYGVDEYYINTIINKLQKISKHFKRDPT